MQILQHHVRCDTEEWRMHMLLRLNFHPVACIRMLPSWLKPDLGKNTVYQVCMETTKVNITTKASFG